MIKGISYSCMFITFIIIETTALYVRSFKFNFNGKMFLLYPATYRQERFDVNLPFISEQFGRYDVDIYVQAYDTWAASIFKFQSINVTNTFARASVSEYFAVMWEMYENGTLATDLGSQLFIANNLEIIASQPRLPIHAGVLCMTRYHCFDHGECLINKRGT